jgi:hypothetical protein
MCFSILIDVTNFNIVPADSIGSDLLFKCSQSDPFNDNFDAIGYNSLNAIENLQSLFYYMLLIPILYIILFSAGRVADCCPKCMMPFRFLESRLKHGFALRFLIESYLEVIICFCLNLISPQFSTFGDYLSSLLSLFGMILYLAFPFVTYVFLKRKIDSLNTT